VLDDAGLLAAAGELVGLGGDEHRLAGAPEVDAVSRGREADRGAAVRPLGTVEQVDQAVADDAAGLKTNFDSHVWVPVTPTPRRPAQPGYGGASPQPQRGTGASGGGSAPGCELASAIRVPHST
jgi:hypothetical protein